MTNNTTAVLTDEQILALNAGEAHFSESPSKYLEAGHGTQYQAGAPGVLSFARAVERAILTSPRAAAPQWVLASDRLPDSSRTVLATYLNCSDKARRIRAQYVAAKTREASGETDELEGVYDEESDTYYWPEGWYECIDNWGDLSHVQVTEGAVTHWMEMPPLPGDAAPAAPVASPSIDIEQMLRDCVPGGDIVDPQLVCDNIRGWFADHAQAVAADGAAGGGWPMLSKGHLESLMFAYNEGWQKAYDGREFANPFAETGSQAAAWELGTRDGKERRKIHARAAVSPATADTTWTAPKQHCQNGGDVCLAGNHDGVCCPEDSCDIDDGTRKNPSVLPIKIPHVHIRPEDEEIGRQYYALGFVDGSRSITDAPQPATADEQRAAFEAWFADAWNAYPDKETTSEIKSKVWALKAWRHLPPRAAASQPAAAAGQEATEAFDYDDVVSICDAHGIGLPVDCIEMVVEIVRHSAPPAQVATRQGLTERQRMDLLLVADDMEVSGDAKLADALRALLKGGKQ
ncbi:DUF551 domain-containing protein [Burkholderia gladioli]|uniref:DUF551 domain-containing protein n=1 Tax=Burkholderia gladioli TaxID=28095 RepID=UPI001640C4C6|nr:DUF551 domain-containing protein [Burkholderia gladioli]